MPVEARRFPADSEDALALYRSTGYVEIGAHDGNPLATYRAEKSLR